VIQKKSVFYGGLLSSTCVGVEISLLKGMGMGKGKRDFEEACARKLWFGERKLSLRERAVNNFESNMKTAQEPNLQIQRVYKVRERKDKKLNAIFFAPPLGRSKERERI